MTKTNLTRRTCNQTTENANAVSESTSTTTTKSKFVEKLGGKTDGSKNVDVELMCFPKESDTDVFLSKKQVRELFGQASGSTINKWIKTRGFPEPIRLSKTFPLWSKRELIKWINAQGKK